MVKVLLFGTSGNPPTGVDGHSGIVEYFVSLRQFDEIWVLPVYVHMFAAKRAAMESDKAVTYDDRVEMCRLAFERHSSATTKVRVSRTEQEVYMWRQKEREGRGTEQAGTPAVAPKRTSTYDVVEFLRAKHPGVEFHFLVGTDAYQDLKKGKWRKSEELLKLLKFVVVDRLGVRPETEDLLAGIETHHPPMLTDISSTKIRDASVEELESTFTVDPPVLEYMRRNQLYGFGRQRRKIVKDSVLTRRLLVASAVGVVFAIGMTAVVVGSRQKGGQGRG